MSRERFTRIKAILLEIADLSESERASYLDEVCADEPDLRAEIKSILRHEVDGSSLGFSVAAHSLRKAIEPRSGPNAELVPALDPTIGRTLAHYNVVERIGEGGMGVIYRARDLKLGREVALKLLPGSLAKDSSRLERFQREARSIASLNHPNIVTLYSVEEADGIDFLTMELVEGKALDRLIPETGLDITALFEIAIPLCEALWAAHQKGVVHRDLKPANIMLSDEGRVKVLDFGLAKMMGADVDPSERTETPDSTRRGARDDSRDSEATRTATRSPETRAGGILGTVPYMAPEQLRGQAVDARTDIFALGVVLHELATGRRPFDGDTTAEVMASILRDEPADVGGRRDDLPEQLGRLILRCLAKDPAHRYPRARDVRNDLDDLQREIEWGERSPDAAGVAAAARAAQHGTTPSTDRHLRRSRGALTAYYESRIAEWTKPRYKLDREFVELTLLLDQGVETASGRWRAQARRHRDLGELLESIDDPAIVVLGPPGCGKSTLLRRLELDVAQAALRGDDDRLTFFVQLNQYEGRGRSSTPETWLADRWEARYSELPTFKETMRQGRMLLLIDALNEMRAGSPAELFRTVLEWKSVLERLTTDHPGNRFVFSCRTLDYSAPLSTPTLRVPQVIVEPLTDEQVERFLIKRSPARGADMWSALRGSPQLELMRSPYFLSLFVNEVEATGEMPKGRAGLFTGFVRNSIRRELERGNPLFAPDALLSGRDVRRLTQWTWRDGFELPERGPLVPKLVDLGFGMQSRSVDGGASQLRVALVDALDLVADERGEDILRAGVSLSVLEEDSATAEVMFVHQLLQEYFAARHLAAHPQPERVRTAWKAREVRPPLVEVMESLGPGEKLPALVTTGWEETALLAAAMAADSGEFVRGLVPHQLELAARCATQPEVQPRLSAELMRDLRAALVERSRHPEADPRIRIAAGLTLGSLGDPRFERHAGPDGDYLLPPMAEIPGGRYPIGEDDPFDYVGNLITSHVPRHEVEIQTFLLGRFPVTNAEWSLFMEAGGYDDQRWWTTPAARRWWTGEGTADPARNVVFHTWRMFRENPERLEEFWRSGRWSDDIYKLWKERVAMNERELNEDCQRHYPARKEREPRFWHHDQFNNPSQPVVGVCWFEALAYANWLSAQAGARYRLPTEIELEASTRGHQALRYAWGDVWQPLQGNVADTQMRRTTPVGVFPEGDTPAGVSDLTGNVFEWTASIYGSGLDDEAEYRYPYRPDDGRENLAAGSDVRRVLRGGSFNCGQVESRSAFRDALPPGYRTNWTNGFRLARSL